jgi:hypothetical protein
MALEGNFEMKNSMNIHDVNLKSIAETTKLIGLRAFRRYTSGNKNIDQSVLLSIGMLCNIFERCVHSNVRYLGLLIRTKIKFNNS